MNPPSRSLSNVVSLLVFMIVILGAAFGFVSYQYATNNSRVEVTTTVQNTVTYTKMIVSTQVSTVSASSVAVTRITNNVTTVSSQTSCGVVSVSELANMTQVALAVSGINTSLSILPAVPQVSIGNCNYTQVQTSTPTSCGVLCGGGIGYIDSYSYELVMEITLQAAAASRGGNYSVTLAVPSSPTGNLTRLFGGVLSYIEVNSKQVSWSATPPCLQGSANGATTEQDCMNQDSTSISFSLPYQAASSAYGIAIISSVTTVP